MTHIFTEWKTRPANGPWIVRVYNNSDREIASWIIKDRTEREAYREAMSEVEQCWPCRDWSMTPIPNGGADYHANRFLQAEDLYRK